MSKPADINKTNTATKAMIISIAIVLLLVMSIVFFYMAGKVDSSAKLDAYNARKEDLIQSSERMQSMLADLNSRIAQEIENQKQLETRITELSEKADLPPPVVNTTRVEQPPPVTIVIPATPAPTPVPTRTPVTRAS